jgi:hypothetical protein
MKNFAIIVISWVLLAGSPMGQTKSIRSRSWKLISSCGVKFYAPPDIREEKVRGIDSCVRQYRSPNTLIELDAIMYSDPNGSRRDEYSDKRDFNLRKTKIDGQNAEIITCYETDLSADAKGLNYSAVLYVPRLPKERGNLTIWTYSKTSEARDLAIKMLGSVQLAKE